MAKLTLTDLAGGFFSVTTFNGNNTLIETALENTLSRDGTSPNTMSVDLDMNSNKVTNMTDGTANQDGVTVAQLDAVVAGAGGLNNVVEDLTPEFAADLNILDAKVLWIWDAANTSAFSVRHDGTDVNILGTLSTDLNITGFTNLDLAGNLVVSGTVDGVDVAARDANLTTAEATLADIPVGNLADGTDGELITWDAAGAPAVVAVGTATEVLTSNGVGVAPTFQAAGGGLSDGTATDNTLTWNGSAWVESEVVKIDSAAFQLQLPNGSTFRQEKFAASGTNVVWSVNSAPDLVCTSTSVTDFEVLNFDRLRVTGGGILAISETAAPQTNVAGDGQYWVRSSAPNRPTFTDDSDVDQLLDPSISEIVSITANHPIVMTDKGKTIGFTGATAAQTVTIPANGSIGFQIGTMIAIDNSGSVSISIAITTDTLTWSADNTTGTRTLAAGGTAVIQKVGATSWKISGSALLT